MSERPTAAVALAVAENAHAKIDTHEEICALRYTQIFEKLGELKADNASQKALLQTILLFVTGSALTLLVSVVLFKSGLIG
jgi:hypothetical protein